MYQKKGQKRTDNRKRPKRQPVHQALEALYWDCLETVVKVMVPPRELAVYHTNENEDQAFMITLEAIARHLEKKREARIPKTKEAP